MATIAEQLRLVRIQHGLTQQQVADRIKTAQSAISELERGVSRPRIDTADRYARLFGLRLTLLPADDSEVA